MYLTQGCVNMVKNLQGIGIIFTSLMILAGCFRDEDQIDVPEGEALSEADASRVIEDSLQALEETSGVDTYTEIQYESEIGGMFSSGADTYDMAFTIEMTAYEDAFHIQTDAVTDDGNENEVEMDHSEMILYDGILFEKGVESGEWRSSLFDEEALDIDTESDQSYLDTLASMDEDEYSIVENDETYIIYIAAEDSGAIEDLNELLTSTVDTTSNDTLAGIGTEYFGFIQEISKETLLPERYSVEMYGTDDMMDDDIIWQQSISGEFNYDDVSDVEPPLELISERPYLDTDTETFIQSKDFSAASSEDEALLESLYPLDSDRYTHEYHALYTFEDKNAGESYRVAYKGEVIEDYTHGRIVMIEETPELFYNMEWVFGEEDHDFVSETEIFMRINSGAWERMDEYEFIGKNYTTMTSLIIKDHTDIYEMSVEENGETLFMFDGPSGELSDEVLREFYNTVYLLDSPIEEFAPQYETDIREREFEHDVTIIAIMDNETSLVNGIVLEMESDEFLMQAEFSFDEYDESDWTVFDEVKADEEAEDN